MIELSQKIIDYILDNFGEDYLAKYKEYISNDYIPYLRFGDLDIHPQKLIDELSCYNIQLEPIDNIPGSYKIVNGIENAGKTIEFTIGKYYIQSLSSMIPPLILNPQPLDKVLDCCAAPGSKTTQLAELMNNRGTLVANEPNISRLKALAHNVDKMTSVNIGISKLKGELISKYLDGFFDKSLVDVPCSALGILQKKGEVSNWWNKNQVEKISSLQLKLLISAIKTLKVGGEIVYSTCTLTLEENELVINKVLEKYPVELVEINLPVKSVEGFTKYKTSKLNPNLSKTRRIIPWEINSEGFFVAKLRKIGRTESLQKFKFPNRGLKLINFTNNKIRKYIEELHHYFGIPLEVFKDFKYLIRNNNIFIVNKDWDYPLIDLLIRTGIPLGNIDRKNLLRLHSHGAQILSTNISSNIIEIDNGNDLRNYFSGSVFVRNDESDGQKVIKYKDYVLGTAVVLQGKVKSQFPRSKRTHDIIIP